MDAHFEAENAGNPLKTPKRIIHSGIGDVTRTDVAKAEARGATIVTYGVDVDRNAIQLLKVIIVSFMCI